MVTFQQIDQSKPGARIPMCGAILANRMQCTKAASFNCSNGESYCTAHVAQIKAGIYVVPEDAYIRQSRGRVTEPNPTVEDSPATKLTADEEKKEPNPNEPPVTINPIT